MKNVAAGLIVFAIASANAMGGTVTFDPAESTVQAGTEHTFWLDVTVAADGPMGQFNAVTLVFQSEDPLTNDHFTFHPDIAGATPLPEYVEPIPGLGLSVGAYLPDPVESAMLGWIEVTVPAETPIGTYTLLVDSEIDSLSELNLGASSEGVMGSATVHVLPEPSIITMLAVGALGLLRRRR